MQLKPGVKIAGIRPEMVLAALIVETVLRRFADPKLNPDSFSALCVITSALDSKHSAKSFHYEGRALDFRTREIPAELRKDFAEAVHAALGDEFDVVLESDHLHVELDPD